MPVPIPNKDVELAQTSVIKTESDELPENQNKEQADPENKDGSKKDEKEDKEQKKKEEPVVTKFDAAYITLKLYEFDKMLGGNLKEDEKNEKMNDPFYIKLKDLNK